MNKKVSLSLLITVVILAMTVTFSMTMVTAMRIFDKTVSSVKEKENMYEKLAEIDRYVRDNNYYSIDEEVLNDTLASGYVLGSGDKSARYYNAEAYTELQNIKNGTLMGIGVKVVKDSATGYAKVIRVYAGTPAEEMGITKRCYITAIDGTETKNVSSTDALQRLLRGENGTTVELNWLGTDASEHSDTITRRNYVAESIESMMLGGKTGYIRIWDFTAKTASDLDFALTNLKNAGATSIVFDLRDNGSTNWDAAIESINLITPDGTIASALYKNGDTKLLGYSEGENPLTLPYVCLVNGNTANGAELFAASTRTLGGAKLVGTTTAGKGTIQSEPKMLSDGSAVVVTTACVLASDGMTFEGIGLPVDIERALSADETVIYYDYVPENDPQVQKAVAVADSLAGGSTVGQESGAQASNQQVDAGEAQAD